MEQKKIQVDKETVERLERLHYEYNVLVGIETSYLDNHMLDANGDAIESPIYKRYHEKTLAAFKAYEEAKDELIKKFNLEDKTWNLEFKTGEVTID